MTSVFLFLPCARKVLLLANCYWPRPIHWEKWAPSNANSFNVRKVKAAHGMFSPMAMVNEVTANREWCGEKLQNCHSLRVTLSQPEVKFKSNTPHTERAIFPLSHTLISNESKQLKKGHARHQYTRRTSTTWHKKSTFVSTCTKCCYHTIHHTAISKGCYFIHDGTNTLVRTWFPKKNN